MDWIGDQKEFIGANNVSYPYIKVTLNNLSYYIDLDQNTRWRDMDQLGHRWLKALKTNLKNIDDIDQAQRFDSARLLGHYFVRLSYQ